MRADQVESATDFLGFVQMLTGAGVPDPGRTLEEYLRALWALVQQHRQEAPSWALFARLLSDAFTATPAQFEAHWLTYVEPPAELTGGWEDSDDLQFLERMLLYQIADLRRMAEASSLGDPYRYFGTDSPTGHRWFNFDPQTYLECAAAGLECWVADVPCRWGTLGELLWLGQIYE